MAATQWKQNHDTTEIFTTKKKHVHAKGSNARWHCVCQYHEVNKEHCQRFCLVVNLKH